MFIKWISRIASEKHFYVNILLAQYTDIIRYYKMKIRHVFDSDQAQSIKNRRRGEYYTRRINHGLTITEEIFGIRKVDMSEQHNLKKTRRWLVQLVVSDVWRPGQKRTKWRIIPVDVRLVADGHTKFKWINHFDKMRATVISVVKSKKN